jgi:NAD+-dependent secondary alcohol dehydrogenase Adh1
MRNVNKELSGSLVELDQAATPEVIHPFDVRVKIAATGVCRTDLHIISGLLPVGVPHVLGHENAGWVDQVGSMVTTVKIGDPVVCFPFVSNGLSTTERRGLDTNAPNRVTPGINAPGGYAEYLLTNERAVIKVPETADLCDLATLTDAGLAAYRACKRASKLLGVGDTAIIIGIGGLGHLAVQILQSISSADIVAVDNKSEALAMATSFGIRTTCLSQDLTETYRGKATVVLDFVGTNSTSAAALECLAFGGTYLVIGAEGSVTATMLDLIANEIHIEGIYVGTYSELQEVTHLALSGQIQPHIQKYDLEDADQALHDLLNGKIIGRAVLIP